MERFGAPELLTIIAAIGVLITGVGAVIVNVIVALRTGKKVDDNLTETVGMRAEVKEVHTLTNSALAAVKAELATSAALNAELRVVIRDLKNEREKLAISVASALQPGLPLAHAVPIVPIVDDVVDSLDAIKQSTDAIDKNTRKK